MVHDLKKHNAGIQPRAQQITKNKGPHTLEGNTIHTHHIIDKE